MNNILIINNLPENISPLMLFRLFGMYGNVLKVKILFNKPEKAFIEFQSIPQAEMARSNLNNCNVLGNNIFVDFAKKGTVVDVSLLKKEPNNNYMGDFSNSSEHRYKYVGSKNHSNISPPSKVLHLSNLLNDKDEYFFTELFKDCGKIEKFMFMKNTENMALVEMGSVAEANLVLMIFHNFNIDGKFLKVSFSKYKKVK
jgi:hnRNP-L/PTB/hephaestus splicing factor